MKNKLMLLNSLELLALIIFTVINLTQEQGEQQKRVVCYVGTWSVYRAEKGSFDMEHIDAQLCTHLIYAFVGLDNDTNKMISIQEHRDITKGGFNKFVALRKKNPNLKILLAIGGWNEGAEKYSKMAASKETRNTFITSAIEFIKKYDFDGLDLDWEYPGHIERGGTKADKQHFTLLVQELRASMPKSWLLTAAISANKNIIENGYEMEKLSKDFDFFNVMCYDYHGNWETKTGHNAPVYSRPDEDINDQTLNVHYSVQYIRSTGVPNEKIIVGVPFYGHTFVLVNEKQNSVGSPTVRGEGDKGPFTAQSGFMGYNEICILGSEWTDARDDVQKVPYKFNNLSWISYDDPESILLKAQLTAELGLGGVMIWSLDTDDFLATCSSTKFPLTKAIIEGLRSPPDSTPDSNDVLPPGAPPHAPTPRPSSANETTRALTTVIGSLLFLVFILEICNL